MADPNSRGETHPSADPDPVKAAEPAELEQPREPAEPERPRELAEPERVGEPAEPERVGGESACLLHLVCAECGALAEQRPPTVCRRCGAVVDRE
ncbi:hypothetical protein LN042_17625 [Kitasatospora sp. RB6PN24]|uniref:hypothetical protein n=1 Tax=Kitasatospora humi TaxID=2893891 RepID=UPI001E439844|nr:hypothetical protein [Kitasatospora humi]MCC9308884.1 hypothetical protein [Kitasatospora humi]